MAIDKPRDAHAGWLSQVQEETLEPDLPICDAHHHLWRGAGATGSPYLLADLHRDTGSGHNVVQTVFLECHAEYRTDGPEHLRCVGETAFVADIAAASAGTGGAEITAIMAAGDVALGDRVAEVLAAHEAVAGGRLRGIRYSTAQDAHPPLAMRESAPMSDRAYLEGVRKVGALGYTYDAMVYHPQLPELVKVAQACPETPIVINHLGCVLGTGPYKNRRDEILDFWREQMTALADCPNTWLKVGGIGMPMMGFRWDKQARPPTSEELAAPWTDPIRFVIDAFGPDRCMFESNYPVDGRGAGYHVLWNAYKRIAAPYTADEKRDLFHNTAARAYRLTPITA